MHDDPKADAPLTPDEERALREAWACIGAWEPWDEQDEGATYVCPLCNGEGETEGVILDATKPFAATLHPCGTGPGLAAAELVAGATGRLLATVDTARLERDEAVEALRHASEVLRSLALVHCGHDGDEESGQCDADCARCAIEGALAHAASVRGGDQ